VSALTEHLASSRGSTSDVLSALVAVDRSDEALAAVRLAGALETLGRIRPRVIHINEQFAFDARRSAASAVRATNALLTDDSRNTYLRELRAHMAAVAPMAVNWPLQLAVGQTVQGIADEVGYDDVDILITGLRRHGVMDRMSGDETTLNLIRALEVPVLGTAFWLHHAPKRVLVGIEFGHAGDRAAAFTCRLLADRGTLTLAYVDPAPRSANEAEDSEGFGVIHREGIHAAFARIRDSLPLPPGARVETAELTGNPATALLDCADRLSTDLIAVGRQSHNAISRLLLGSVTTAIVRDGRCSVLAMPVG
jgi:nucleotide-binding universal stress UspA family protein